VQWRKLQILYQHHCPTEIPHQTWDPPSLLSIGTLGYFPGVKRPHNEFIAEVKNKWSYTAIPHMSSWCAQELYLFFTKHGEEEHVAGTWRIQRHTTFSL
jgi:hypothetical protein